MQSKAPILKLKLPVHILRVKLLFSSSFLCRPVLLLLSSVSKMFMQRLHPLQIEN
jgi:hypothetical protein